MKTNFTLHCISVITLMLYSLKLSDFEGKKTAQ
jgi:hypothetical protein